MTVPAAEATTSALFLDFPARAYLEKYYSTVGAENAAILRAILAGLSRPAAVSPRVIEVGGGPSLFSLMAMAARQRRCFRRVTFTDIAAANLGEVRWWLEDDPRQFDYRELLSWLEAEVGVDPLVVTESLRSSPWDLVRFDWLASDAPNWYGAFDVVSSHFFAESATDDKAELLDLLGKVARLGRQGATILLSFLCRSHGYRVGDQEFPAFPLQEDDSVLEVLEEAGISLVDPQVRAAPTEDPDSHPDYDGMVFVAGRLACAPVDGKQAGLSMEPMARCWHSGGTEGSTANSQSPMPYAEALGGFAQQAARLHVPGHKGGACTSPETVSAIGERVLAIDVPNATYGIDRGPDPTALERSRVLAAEAWGARRTWFLTNGASQANHIACLALAQRGDGVVVQRNVHSSVIHGLLLSGLRPTFAAPEVDPELGIVHCLTPDALHRALAGTPEAVGAMVVSPTYFGAVADVRALAAVAHEHGVPLVVDEAWGAQLAFHESLPEDALSAGADLVVSSTHKILGSLSQSAMLHLGQGAGPWLEERAIDQAKVLVESTSPSSVLLASLYAARHNAAVRGRERLKARSGRCGRRGRPWVR